MKPLIHKHWKGLPSISQLLSFIASGMFLGIASFIAGEQIKVAIAALFLYFSWDSWNAATDFEL